MTKKKQGLNTMTDVLKNAAARIFNVPIKEVTPEMREALRLSTFGARYGRFDDVAKIESLDLYLNIIKKYKESNQK